MARLRQICTALLLWSLFPQASAWDESYNVRLTRAGFINQAVVQRDGKIVVRGHFTFIGGIPRSGLARLNGDGSLDRTFVPEIEGTTVTVTQDGNGGTVVFSKFENGDFSLRRLDDTGRWVREFDVTVERGWYSDSGAGEQLLTDPDGKVLFLGKNHEVNGGQRFGMVRLLADGKVDETLDLPREKFFVPIRGVAFERDGTMLVANGKLHRISKTGEVLKSFDLGFGTVDGVVPLENGKAILFGSFPGSGGLAKRVVRLLEDGLIDDSYHSPINADNPQTLVLPSGQIVVLTYPIFVLDQNGDIIAGHNLPPFAVWNGALAEMNGKIIISSSEFPNRSLRQASFGLVRMTLGGEIDPAFQIRGGVMIPHGGISKMEIGRDDALYVAGEFGFVNGTNAGSFVKLTKTGEIDEVFAVNSADKTGLAVDPIPFSLEDTGNVRLERARLGHDGQTLIDFPDFRETCFTVSNIQALPNNAALITKRGNGPCAFDGPFVRRWEIHNGPGTSVREISFSRFIGPSIPFARLTEPAIVPGEMYFASRSGEDKLIVGGNFHQINGVARTNLARIDLSGQVDEGFAVSETIFEPQTCIRVNPDLYVVVTKGSLASTPILIHLNGRGEVKGRSTLPENIEEAGEVILRDSELIINTRSYHSGRISRRIATVNLDGTLLQQVVVSLDRPEPGARFPLFAMTLTSLGDVLVAGQGSNETGSWSGIRKVARSETDPFQLRIQEGRFGRSLWLRSPQGRSIRIVRSTNLREWSVEANVIAPTSQPLAIPIGDAAGSVFFRAETN